MKFYKSENEGERLSLLNARAGVLKKREKKVKDGGKSWQWKKEGMCT